MAPAGSTPASLFARMDNAIPGPYRAGAAVLTRFAAPFGRSGDGTLRACAIWGLHLPAVVRLHRRSVGLCSWAGAPPELTRSASAAEAATSHLEPREFPASPRSGDDERRPARLFGVHPGRTTNTTRRTVSCPRPASRRTRGTQNPNRR